MTNTIDPRRITTTARLAGVGYLILAICGGFAEFFVRQRLVVPDDAAATATNILANVGTFRLGIGAELLGQVVFVFLVFALYDLLKIVHRRTAILMVTLVVVAVTITCLNMVNQFAALVVLQGGPLASAFDPAQAQALAMTFLELHSIGYSVVAQVFFGLWLVPLGMLIWRSGFTPKAVGALLVVAGVGYLVDVVLGILAPSVGFTLSEFTFVGELALMLWLLVRGVNAKAWERSNAVRAEASTAGAA